MLKGLGLLGMDKLIKPQLFTEFNDEDQDISFSCYMAVKNAKLSVSDNLDALFSIFNSMNNLYSSLEKLDIKMENFIFNKYKGKEDETQI